MNARHCVWETSAGLFLYWSWEDRSCELRRAGISCCYGYRGSLLWLGAGWLLTGFPLRPPPASPLDCLLLLVLPACSLCWLTREEGQGTLSLSVLGGPWALGTCLSPGGSVIGSYWSCSPTGQHSSRPCLQAASWQ